MRSSNVLVSCLHESAARVAIQAHRRMSMRNYPTTCGRWTTWVGFA
jgi:hypothetical protein